MKRFEAYVKVGDFTMRVPDIHAPDEETARRKVEAIYLNAGASKIDLVEKG